MKTTLYGVRETAVEKQQRVGRARSENSETVMISKFSGKNLRNDRILENMKLVSEKVTELIEMSASCDVDVFSFKERIRNFQFENIVLKKLLEEQVNRDLKMKERNKLKFEYGVVLLKCHGNNK